MLISELLTFVIYFIIKYALSCNITIWNKGKRKREGAEALNPTRLETDRVPNPVGTLSAQRQMGDGILILLSYKC